MSESIERCTLCGEQGNSEFRLHHLVAKHGVIIIGDSDDTVNFVLRGYFNPVGET